VAGVLIFEGMEVGFLAGDFSISIDEHGNLGSKAILSTSYNVLPLWLRIAHENLALSRKASESISSDWCDDAEIQKAFLLAELTPSIQVFVACGIALDALYDQLRPFAHVNKQDVEVWRKKKTSRAAIITEVVRRVYKLDNTMTKVFRHNTGSILEYRDKAVHPSHGLMRSCTRPDIKVGVDWRFSAYRYSNAEICYKRTMEMLLYIYEKKAKSDKANQNMEYIIKALKELKLITEQT
jgi:hypothetical protein